MGGGVAREKPERGNHVWTNQIYWHCCAHKTPDEDENIEREKTTTKAETVNNTNPTKKSVEHRYA